MSSLDLSSATDPASNTLRIIGVIIKFIKNMEKAAEQFGDAEKTILQARELINDEWKPVHHKDGRLKRLFEAEMETFKGFFHLLETILKGIKLPSCLADNLTLKDIWKFVVKLPSITALRDKLHRSLTCLLQYRTLENLEGQRVQTEINMLAKTSQDMFEAGKKKLINMTLPDSPPDEESLSEWNRALKFEQNEIKKGDGMVSMLQEYAAEQSARIVYNGRNIRCIHYCGGTNTGHSLTNYWAGFEK